MEKKKLTYKGKETGNLWVEKITPDDFLFNSPPTDITLIISNLKPEGYKLINIENTNP